MAETTTAPAAVWPAAWFIRDFMNARGWDEDDLGREMNVSVETVQALLGGLSLNSEPYYAERLAAAFGTSKEVWISVDKAFWDALASELYYLTKNDGA